MFPVKEIFMKYHNIFCIWLCLLIPDVSAQQTTTGAETFPPPVELTKDEDHRRMMDLLGITELRPGANGMDKNAPNYANYDESKANPYPDLPEILVTNSGQKVTTPEMWWNVRRPEIVELFDREIYGRVPEIIPVVKWEVVETKQDTVGTTIMKTRQLLGHVDNSAYPHITVDIQLSLSTPADAAGPVPVMLEFGFAGFGRGGRGGFGSRPRPANAPPSWQEQVAARGWGYAIITPNSIQADNGAGLTQGIIGLCNKGQPRDADDWGVLRAWAWGARAVPWTISKPTLRSMPDRWGSRAFPGTARRQLSHWRMTSALPPVLLRPQAKVGRPCIAAIGVNVLKTSQIRTHTIG